MTNVYSAVGLTTTQDLSTYDVRSFNPSKSADNKAYVSSLTDGKTFRVEGNLDSSVAISLYAKDGESEIPAALRAGKVISVQLVGDSQLYTYIVDTADVEVDVESGELIAYSLACSADSATSYHAGE